MDFAEEQHQVNRPHYPTIEIGRDKSGRNSEEQSFHAPRFGEPKNSSGQDSVGQLTGEQSLDGLQSPSISDDGRVKMPEFMKNDLKEVVGAESVLKFEREQ